MGGCGITTNKVQRCRYQDKYYKQTKRSKFSYKITKSGFNLNLIILKSYQLLTSKFQNYYKANNSHQGSNRYYKKA